MREKARATMTPEMEHFITIEGPFKPASNPPRDAKAALAKIRFGDAMYKAMALITGPSESALSPGQSMRKEDLEEARGWFSLLEIAKKSEDEWKAMQANGVPEVVVQVPPIPDFVGRTWTVDRIRWFVKQELPGYDVQNEGTTWSAKSTTSSLKSRIERLEISGYRVFDGFAADLRDLTIIIGANASGKSSLFDFLRFLGFAASNPLPPEIDPWSIGRTLFHDGRPEKIIFGLDADLGQPRPLRYKAEIHGPIGAPTVTRETLATIPHRGEREPFTFLDFKAGRGVVRDQVEGKLKRPEWTVLPNELALRRALDPTLFTLSKFQSFLASWRFYSGFDVSRSAAIRRPVPSEPSPTLADDGANLSAVLFWMMSEDQSAWQELEVQLRAAIPNFQSLHVRPQGGPGTVIGVWRESALKGDLTLADLSDGTLRLLCWAALCLSRTIPPVICIDEPELGLHPRALPIVAGLLRLAAAKSQIVVATHSPYLLSQFGLEEIAVMRKEDGKAVFIRPNSTSALAREIAEVGSEALMRMHISDELEQRV